MSPVGNIRDLADQLVQLRLVDLGALRACEESLGRQATVDDLLDLLQRRELLTGYQVDKIKKGEAADLVLGDVKLLYRNASGSFARVFRGASLSDGSMVGVKVLRERWASDPETVRLFRREGEIGQRLKHPCIVPIYSVGQQGKVHYITMEFVEGGNLRDFLKIRGKLDPAEAARYGVQIADALEYALNLGMTHRDLKPTNVLMSAQGGVKLIDFGLAADETYLNRTDGPDLAQALEYSTLERGSGAPRNDPRSDLFFLGTILYELVTGTPPYPRTRDRDERKRFSRYRDIRPVTALEPRLPHKLADVIDQLLHTNPDLRYQRPSEVAADLREALRVMGAPLPATNGAADAPPTAADAPERPLRVLCLENRRKHQDVLREYLSKRGYRVWLLSDVDRAVARIEQEPPDGLILMGEAVEAEEVGDSFRRLIEADRSGAMAALLVLSERQGREHVRIPADAQRVRVLQQPVSLRTVRIEVEQMLRALGKPVPSEAGNGE